MQQSLLHFIISYAQLPVWMATIVAILRFRRAEGAMKVLCYLIFFALATEQYSDFLWSRKITNLFLFPIYTVVECSLFIWIYSLLLESQWLRKFRVWLMLVFALTVGSKYLVFDSFQAFIHNDVIDGLSRVIEGGIVIALVIAYFFKLFREIKTPSIHQEPAFWVSGGLLIYFSCTIILYLFANFVRRYSHEFNQSFWLLHAVLNILLYSAYSVALWKLPRK